MKNFDFDDTTSSGIWWSTNVAIRDACTELKLETSCSDKDIVELLENIANEIAQRGL